MGLLINDFINIKCTLYGYGYGHGNGSGHGHGYGTGNGSGYGTGDGNGYGYGCKLNSINGNPVITIDNINTVVYSIKGNVLKGAIIEKNTKLVDCYIVKNDKYFAHGKTIKEAFKALEEKTLEGLPVEELIVKFKSKFKNANKKYEASLFFDWHFILTGSCEFGRKSFIENNDINLEKDKFTVIEFISLVENEYGSDIIEQLKESYSRI